MLPPVPSFPHTANQQLSLPMATETPKGTSATTGVGGGVINQGQCGQPYYGHQFQNETSVDSNFTKVTAQAAYANHANVISLKGTRHASDSSITPHHNQGIPISM